VTDDEVKQVRKATGVRLLVIDGKPVKVLQCDKTPDTGDVVVVKAASSRSDAERVYGLWKIAKDLDDAGFDELEERDFVYAAKLRSSLKRVKVMT